jgi:hypothetical protein
MQSGQLDRAASGYQSAAEQARRDGDAAAQARLEQKAAQARVELAKQKRDQVVALLAQAKADADARRWGSMLSKVEKARKLAPGTGDGALIGQVNAVYDSQVMKIAKTARVYRSMSRQAGWANWQHWLGGDDWFTFYSEVSAERAGYDLEDAARATGDRDLDIQAAEVSRAWREFNRAKELSRARERTRGEGEGVLGVLVDVGVAANEIGKAARYDRKRQAFESRLDVLFNGARFPAVPSTAPAPQPVAVAAPVSAPVASVRAPAAPTPAGGSVPGAVGPDPGGAANQPADTVRPGDDDDQLRRTGGN